MADEVAYGAAGGESNKRKYENSPSPAARRSTGFSSHPDSAAPPPAYKNVPPPMNEIELAKQKAQEIAARLLNNADPSKRARVENSGAGGGFDAYDSGIGQKHMGYGLSGPPQSASYGYPGASKKIEIPNGRVGVIIGKGGETIKFLQMQSGAKIQVTRDMDANPNSTYRVVELTGTPDQIAIAEQSINDVLAEAETGGSGIVSKRLTGHTAGTEQFSMKVPNNKVGLVIGKGGETIKNMQATTGARIQVIPLHLPPGDMSKERTVQIDGTSDQIEAAKQLVEEVTSEGLDDVGKIGDTNMGSFLCWCLLYTVPNRMRNQSMSGGYNTQQGYQARPQNTWSQQGPPVPQPSYSHVQPGLYPGPPQYNANQQPNYAGYPPPITAQYPTGWDQSTAPPQNQQTTQGGPYDYYGQQQPPPQQQEQNQGGPTDGSGYNYGPAQAYGQTQGYSQDSYYQSGYGQSQTNPGPRYGPQQQGYSATYGHVSNPTPPADGHTPSYGTQPDATVQAPAQPSPNPSYPYQTSTQPGYGVSPAGYGAQPLASGYGNYGTPQPAQKPSGQPAAYAQPQQSPQGGGYGQAGYPHPQPPSVQPGYGQTDLGAQRPPQSGYGPPPHGAAPVGQPGYAQPPYGGGYGGYGQHPPAAYSSDEATARQSAQPPPATAKASPPS